MIIRKAKIIDLEQLVMIEQESFPVSEVASKQVICDRINTFSNHFYVIEDNNEIVAFVNGIVSNERNLVDEMYKNTSLHNENGRWIIIFGVATKANYRKQGYAKTLLKEVINDAKKEKRQGLVLACKEELIPFYSSLGFVNEGISQSKHGNEIWYSMRITFNNE